MREEKPTGAGGTQRGARVPARERALDSHCTEFCRSREVAARCEPRYGTCVWECVSACGGRVQQGKEKQFLHDACWLQLEIVRGRYSNANHDVLYIHAKMKMDGCRCGLS